MAAGAARLAWCPSTLSKLLHGPLFPHLPAAPRHLSSSGDQAPAITVETGVPFVGHECDSPPREVETTPGELMGFFRAMARMHCMEIAADALYKAKLIRGFCHLNDGQEAVAVGMEAAITRRDAIITAYGDHRISPPTATTASTSAAVARSSSPSPRLWAAAAGASRARAGR